MTRLILLGLGLAGAVACSDGEPEPAEGDTTAGGACTYEDAETDSSGQPKEPASPPPSDDLRVTVDVEGNGTLSGLEPQCEIEGATGEFRGLLEGTGEIDDNGVYFAVLAQEDASFTTPSGTCEIPDLQIGSVTSVVVRGELTNTQENCTTYCESKARAAAEQECGADAEAAACRGEIEVSYESTCTEECTTSTRKIVAEAALGVDAIAAINASGLTASGLGEIEVDLTFDHVEEEDGTEIDEAP